MERPLLANKTALHALHITKTGGSAVSYALRAQIASGAVIWHDHDARLRDIPPGTPVCFFLRHPLTRFISAFHSRRRGGRPRYDLPWKDSEAAVFRRFATPNDLAEALSAPDAATRDEALAALKVIERAHPRFGFWFVGTAEVMARRGDIMLIGLQETLRADFDRLRLLLEIQDEVALPDDAAPAHRAPPGEHRSLSQLGAQTIAQRYASDIAFYADMCDLRAALMARSGAPGLARP
jgi:hypothetical protein